MVVAAVPWARHDAAFTRSFEDQTAWLTVNTSKTAVAELMRIAWRTVGWICARVAAEALIYRIPFQPALELLDAWLTWARRCRLQPFVKLAKTITKQRSGIEAALRNGLSNARTERINTQIRLITRRGFGYHSPWAVIALAMLSLGGLCPPLPGR